MKLTADEQILQQALLDTLDAYPYCFYETAPLGNITEDYANRERLDFVDRVIVRLRKAMEPVEIPGIGRVIVYDLDRTIEGLRGQYAQVQHLRAALSWDTRSADAEFATGRAAEASQAAPPNAAAHAATVDALTACALRDAPAAAEAHRRAAEAYNARINTLFEV